MNTTESKTTISHHPQTRPATQPFFQKDGIGTFFSIPRPQAKPFFSPISLPQKDSSNNSLEQGMIQRFAENDEIIKAIEGDAKAPDIHLTKKEAKAVKKYGERYEALKVERSEELSTLENERAIEDYLRPIMKDKYSGESWWKVEAPKSRGTNWTEFKFADELYFQQYDIVHGADSYEEIIKETIDEYFTPANTGFQHADVSIGTEHKGGLITISIVNASLGKDELEIFACDENGTVLREILPPTEGGFNINKKGESIKFQVEVGEAFVRIISYRSSENLADNSAKPHDLTFYKVEFEKKIIRKKPIRFAGVLTIPKPGKAQRLRNGKFMKN